MTQGWRTATVSELQEEGILLVEDGNHGEYRPRPNEFTSQGVAFIRAADMDAGRVLFGTASKINDQARRRITKGVGARGDVLLSHKGTVGKVALVPEDAPPFVCSPQTTFWRARDPRKLNHRYLHAFLRSPGFLNQLYSRAGETDMAPYVSLTAQRALTVVLPPVSEQLAIARILGTLDDKIALNRKANETLEAMARALFKSWFVDFDPVRARLEGRRPVGMDEGTAKLFPESLTSSAVGLVPKGWRIGQLQELVELRRGHDLPACERRPGRVPVVSSSGITGVHDVAKAEAPGVITGRYGTIGKVLLLEEAYWPLNTTLYSANLNGNDPYFICHALGQVDFEKYNDNGDVPGINRNHLHSETVVLQPIAIQNAYGEIVARLRCSGRAKESESHVLTQLRDTLLPKLLSGELRIPAAESIAGKVL